MPFVEPIIAYGMGATLIIALLVQVLKTVGLVNLATAPWFTLVMSIVVMGIAYATAHFPELQQFVDLAVGALLIFAASTGLYHAGKNVAVSQGWSTGGPPKAAATKPVA